jgi:hypothetical protein
LVWFERKYLQWELLSVNYMLGIYFFNVFRTLGKTYL